MAQAATDRTTQPGAPLTSHGFEFDTAPDSFGELRDSSTLASDITALRQRMDEDGYLFLRGYLDREQILAVRREFVAELDSVGLIDRTRPLIDAIYSGTTERLGRLDRAAFAKRIRTGAGVRALCHQGPVVDFYERFLGGPVLPYQYIWVRNVRVGAATGVHFDWVYMGRGTPNLYTTWIPIGDVPLSDGPLAILEQSHRIEDLRHTYGAIDADRDRVFSNTNHRYAGGWLTKDAPSVRARTGTRWLTTDFQIGDMLLFGMFTLHCSLDNRSPEDRIRLSIDARYQLASEPADERWIGEDYFGDGMDNPVA